MNRIEPRVIIRYDYKVKHYEIIHKDETTFVYDYGLERILEGEVAGAVLKELKIPVAKAK